MRPSETDQGNRFRIDLRELYRPTADMDDRADEFAEFYARKYRLNGHWGPVPVAGSVPKRPERDRRIQRAPGQPGWAGGP